MSDYAKVAVTVPAPGSPTPSDQPGPKSRPHPSSTRPKSFSDDETPVEGGDPWSRSTYSEQPTMKASTNEKGDPFYIEHPSQQQGQLRPAPVKPSLRERCHKCEKILRRLLPLILLFFYTILGGIVFHYVEARSQTESDIAKGHRVLIDQPAAIQLEKRMTEIVLDRNYTHERRRYEVREALLWYLRQLSEEEKSRWDFVSSLFYSMTLYTTIGYGDTPPKTTTGKILTVIYSIIGIPLALLALIEIGYLIGWLLSKLWSCLRRCCSRRSRKRAGDWEALPSSDSDKRDQKREETEEDYDLLSFPLSVLFILTFLWILFTALLFYAWEYASKWTYAESLYFTFISFTTIGLGDYVPETKCGKIIGIIFLLIGLALVSTMIAVLQQQLEALQNAMKRAIDWEYQDSQTDVSGPMATEDKEVDDGLKQMASKLPPGSAFLFKTVMPEGKKKNIKKYYSKKAGMVPKSMQTDDYLWAMTSMSRSFQKKMAEDKGGAGTGAGGYGSDDTKSRDDVNSLVLMCDYSLPYDYHSKPNY